MENAPMHRPMRQASRQVRNVDQLHAIVEACHTVRIGALDEEGMFIVPMSFGYDWADPESPANNAPYPTPGAMGALGLRGTQSRAFRSRTACCHRDGYRRRRNRRPLCLRLLLCLSQHHGYRHRSSNPRHQRKALRAHPNHEPSGSRSQRRLYRPGTSAHKHLLHRHRFFHRKTARLEKLVTRNRPSFLRQHETKGGLFLEQAEDHYVTGLTSRPASTPPLFRYTNSGTSSKACGIPIQAARTAQRTAATSRSLSRNRSCRHPSWLHA